ncbi:MAG: PAS domain S-box protein [Myxococcales bacterium]|nr:PAS domain S-box protein [Myxococcales bacterium]
MQSDLPWGGLPIAELLDAAPVLLVCVDSEGRILHANRRVEALSGRHVSSLEGQRWCSLFVPREEQAGVQQAFKDVLSGAKDRTILHHLQTANGPKLAIEWRTTLLRDVKGTACAVFAIGVDVTDRQQTEQALSALEQHYGALISTSPVGVYRADAQGRCSFANQRYCDILGITQREALDDGLRGRIHPDDVGPVLAELDRAHHEHSLFRLEYRLRHARGEHIWVLGQSTPLYDEQGQLTGHIGTLTDVSDMRRTEAALRETEQRYQSLLDQAGHGILLLDRDGRIRDCNRRAGELLGYSVSELVGLRLDGLFRPGESRRHEGSSAPSVEFRSNFELRHKQGHYLRVDMRFIALKGGSSLVTARELPARPTSTEEPRATEARVRAQSRLLDRIFQHTADPMAVLDTTFRVIRASESFSRAAGTLPERVVEKSLFAYLPDTLRVEFEQAQLTQTPLRKCAFPLSSWPSSQGGATYWDLELVPILDGSRELDLWLLTLRDVSERIRCEQDLRRAEQRLAEAQRLAHVGAWELDLRTQSIWWSDEMYRIAGIEKKEGLVNREFCQSLVPEEDRHVTSLAIPSALASGEWAGHFRIRRPDGELRTLYSIARVMRDAAGMPMSLAGANQDVTEQCWAAQRLADSLREKETLLREIHHRVKNNLQVVAGLLHFQSKKSASAADRDALAEARLRLQAMLLVHERLYQSTHLSRIDMVAYIHALVDALQRSMLASEHVQTVLSVQPLHLPIESAQPIGMILCELLTNAYRHAFPARRPGQVQVSATWTFGRIELLVQDDGIGLPLDFNPQTAGDFGWQLIRTLMMQLDASLLRVPTARGTGISVVIPWVDGGRPAAHP